MATLLPDVIILPITLLSFSAQKQAQQSLLTWQISGNCAYFEIERQTQNAPFQLIGEKVSFVEGQENYDFIDAFPQVGKNTYRLKTTDIDGQISYSDKVVELSFETENMTITAYPNPVNDEILLQTAFSNEKEMTVFLYDIQGKEVLKQVLQEENGKYALNLKNVSTGLYVLKTTMQESGKTSFTKIVKKE